MGDRIELEAAGSNLSAYIATPESQKPGRAVVVLQERWGLVPHIQDVAERFAKAGFLALAPDLYHGDSTTQPDEAGRMLMALDIERAAAELRIATAEARRRAGGAVGVVGFSMGGQLALLAATKAPHDVAACVDFYGIHPKVKLDFQALRCPVLGLFGEQDASVPPAVVAELEKNVGLGGGTIETHIYPGVGHAFFNDTRPDAFDQQAATDAWQRTLRFFEEHLAAI